MKTEINNYLHDFNCLVDQRYANIVATGKAIPWEAMQAYLESRIAGQPAKRPEAVVINPLMPPHDALNDLQQSP